MKISIITACFNAALTIGDCLKSVQSQTCQCEHIIIDGASTDNTVELVRQISPNAHIVSEQDNGLYDAMNKGISLASGDIVGLLNADDFYAGPMVLEMVAHIFSNNVVDACYSDLVYISRNKKDHIVRYWKSCPYHEGLFEKGWAPPHPTFFVRREVYERFGLFDLNFKIAADFELLARLIGRHGIRTIHIPQVTVNMRLGGTTNKSFCNIVKQNIEIVHALNKNKLRISPFYPVFKLIDRFSQFVRSP